MTNAFSSKQAIKVVPTAQAFIDATLSYIQRKTPTVIHKSLPITRIRAFYMRKVKFAQSTFHERIQQILDDFPRLDDVHPFYADLMNVLYDKDHYKLALGQLHTAKNLIDAVGRDYVRLLKYGDSQYRCKQLKIAALGRMVTLIKKQTSALAYLEQVRQHLARLPSIDPNTRTIVLCGYPNVGKSSFMNKITRANVDVQPYPFTTRSLFVGHTDHRYISWQIIDTPGILDHPLEDRNTIEMQSITALAHLRACVLFVIDVSENCGYSIRDQVSLFRSIKPLFSGKPVLLALNKIDLRPPEDLSDENKLLINSVVAPNQRIPLSSEAPSLGHAADDADAAAVLNGSNNLDSVEVLRMSTLSNTGVSEVKIRACEKLLAHRVEAKLRRSGADVINRIHLAEPVSRDDKTRSIEIPQSVIDARLKMAIDKSEDAMEEDDDDNEAKTNKRTEKDLEREHGGAGVYSVNLAKNYMLKEDEWKHDIIPEIMNGKNIADFVDPSVLEMLAKLEEEELEILNRMEVEGDGDVPALDDETMEAYRRIKEKIALAKLKHKIDTTKGAHLPRQYKAVPLSQIAAELKSRGVEEEAIEAGTRRSRSQTPKRRTPSAAPGPFQRSRSKTELQMERARSRSVSEARQLEETLQRPSALGKRSRSQFSRSLTPSRFDGVRNVKARIEATEMAMSARDIFKTQGKKNGEADRTIYNLRPKHLFSGKRGMGKTDRR